MRGVQSPDTLPAAGRRPAGDPNTCTSPSSPCDLVAGILIEQAIRRDGSPPYACWHACTGAISLVANSIAHSSERAQKRGATLKPPVGTGQNRPALRSTSTEKTMAVDQRRAVAACSVMIGAGCFCRRLRRVLESRRPPPPVPVSPCARNARAMFVRSCAGTVPGQGARALTSRGGSPSPDRPAGAAAGAAISLSSFMPGAVQGT